MENQQVKIKSLTDLKTVTRDPASGGTAADIFSQIAALAATSMGLTTGTVGQLTSLGASVIASLQRWASKTIGFMSSDPLMSAYSAMLTQTAFISKDIEERKAWLAHMMAIIKGETGGTMNPSTTNKDGSGRVLAYGLMQHTPDNWSYHSYHFADSAIGTAVANSPLLRSYAEALGDKKLQIMRPINKYGPENSYFYQLIPMLAQTRSLAERYTNTWYWDVKTGWTVRKDLPKSAELQSWTDKLLGKLKYSYIGGRQALLTLLHTNGVNWVNNPKYPAYWGTRFQADVNAVGTLLQDPQLASVIVKPAVVQLPEVVVTATNTAPDAKRIVITSLFADTSIPEHKLGHIGVDIGARFVPLHAMARAKVIKVSQDSKSGKHVIMRLPSGHTVSYSHMSTINVSVGDTVLPLQRVGVSGNTATVDPHLHLVVRTAQGNIMDPLSQEFPYNLNNVLYTSNFAGKGDYLFKHRADKVTAEARHPYLAGISQNLKA